MSKSNEVVMDFVAVKYNLSKLDVMYVADAAGQWYANKAKVPINRQAELWNSMQAREGKCGLRAS